MLKSSAAVLALALSPFAHASLPAANVDISPELESHLANEEQTAQAELDNAEQDAQQSIEVASIDASFVPESAHGAREGRCRTMGGVASWYGPGFQGRKTANGERFNTGALTAAHRTLPFGSMVRVTNSGTGRSVMVRINDRGPYVGGRVIDLSLAAARHIGMSGTARVVLETCI